MEIRPDILQKLLCSVCGEYLSCAPVRMKNDGTVLCGRCCDPEGESTMRITPYEHLVEMFLFPCVNKTHGCTETLYMAEMKDHEEECKYRQYVCPVTESGQCDWSGVRKDILDHCQEQHPDKMLQNPGTITHQNETSHKTFLLAAFQKLFIIHFKVCTTTQNIYHSLRVIGKSALANRYRYKLEVSNNEDTLTRRSDVASQGCMELQVDISVECCICLLKFFGDFKDIIFNMKMECKCVECKKWVIESVWPTDKGWCCADCAPATRQCKRHTDGCSYTDTEWKTTKHEVFYCQHDTWCMICKRDVTRPRDQHYDSAHSDVTYKAGAMWRAPVIVINAWKYVIIISDVGKLCCKYILNYSKFIFAIRTPLHTEQLSDYSCTVKLRNPDTGYVLRKVLPSYYGQQMDWRLILNKDEFLMCVSNNEFDMKIELIKQ